MLWRAIAFCLFVALAAAPSAYADESFVIGVMNDESGPYADLAGPGSVEMARMAIEDFGGKVLGKPIELLVADHQNKVDLGLQIARQWYDERGAKGDLRHHQFGRCARDPGPGEGAQPARHF